MVKIVENYDATYDAHTLLEAEKIRSDKQRLIKAKEALKRIEQEKKQEAELVKNVIEKKIQNGLKSKYTETFKKAIK